MTEPMRPERLAAVLLDLDRCPHGRHQGDTCADCRGGHSLGNFHMPVGTVVGYDRHGESIAVPERKFRHSAEAWRTAAVPADAAEPPSCPRCCGDGIDPDCDNKPEFEQYSCTDCDGTGRVRKTTEETNIR
jgi:hypothetical protein